MTDRQYIPAEEAHLRIDALCHWATTRLVEMGEHVALLCSDQEDAEKIQEYIADQVAGIRQDGEEAKDKMKLTATLSNEA